MPNEGRAVSFDPSVVGTTNHVVWQRLSTDDQAELVANYPLHPSATIPGPTVCGDDVDPRFEAWLDSAYLQRHANDDIADDSIA